MTAFFTLELLYSPMYTLLFRNKSLSPAHQKFYLLEMGVCTYIICNFSIRKNSLLPYLYIQTLIYFSVELHICILDFMFMAGRRRTSQMHPILIFRKCECYFTLQRGLNLQKQLMSRTLNQSNYSGLSW